MNKQSAIKLILYGVVLWVALNIAIFAASLLYGINKKAEMGAPPPLGFVIVAVVMAILSYALGRRYKLASKKHAIMAGLVWSGMMFAFMLVITVANGTQANIFGNWGAYVALIAPAIGPMFICTKKSGISNTLPTS